MSSDREHSENTVLPSDEVHYDNSGDDSTKSFVVLEIPEHVRPTGIRKITFKFTKRKEDCFQQSTSLLGEPACNSFREDSATCSSMCGRNMELKMSKKVVPNNSLTNVKKLLSTGILDGARVMYISASPQRELHGIIHSGGYLCGCASCNYTRVLSAYEFELHAGAKTRHPNNHIYLANGKPIYNIIQELKTSPLRTVDEVIKDIAGSSVNEEFFRSWKSSLQLRNGLVEADKNQIMRPSHQTYKSVKKTAEGNIKKRDNDLHRLLFMPNGLPEGAELAYYIKGQKMLDGYKQGNCIFLHLL
jgi:hypothetical protein